MAIRLEGLGNGVWRTPDARIIDRSGRKRLPIGRDGFVQAMRIGTIVDKTMLIADVLDAAYAATLFCRPRRFGKTLNMTMMKAYLEAPEAGGLTHDDAETLFGGTEVWEADGGAYRAYQGVYPVVHLSLNTAGGETWDESRGTLKGLIQTEYARHGYLGQSERTLVTDQDLYRRVVTGTADDADWASSLAALCRMLRAHHGKDVVLLIDEYDAPVMAAHTHGYYDQAVSFLRRWLTGAIKDGGTALDFACLTGVQRISKESIFSGLNNLYVSTPLNTSFDERYGFTAPEVEALASYLGHDGCMTEAAEWYDGYRFGRNDVYNPWSVLNYLNEGCTPGAYWGNTSSNTVVGELVGSANAKELEDVYTLLQKDGTVERPLDLGVVFPELDMRGDALWSMLYLAGYLTTDDVERPASNLIERRLRIPNREVAELYRIEVIDRFTAQAGGRDRLKILQDALTEGDETGLTEELSRIVRDSMSYLDLVSELPCHALLMGLLFGTRGYGDPISNREAGYGRYDIRLDPDPTARQGHARPLVTIEVKFLREEARPTGDADFEARLRSLAEAGLDQIAEGAYDAVLPPGAEGRLRWGIAFGGKRQVRCVCRRA